MEYLALGGLRVRSSLGFIDLGGARQRRLLAALIVHRETGASTDRLVEAVLGEGSVQRPEATLRTYVARLRRALDDGSGTTVLRTDTGYRLAIADEQLDIARFERLARHGRRLLGVGDPAGASETLRRARELWRGRPYDEFAEQPWAAAEVLRLEQTLATVLEALADAEMLCGRSCEVVPALREHVASDPFRETLTSRLMLALYRSGRPVEALEVFAEYRRRAADELGIDPGPELVELHRRMLARDPALEAPASALPVLRGYRLTERLGSGAEGTVFAATSHDTDRHYALRVYREDIADDPEVVGRFEADARLFVDLDHPGLVRVYDAWREPGVAVIVMRRLVGGTLRDRLDDGSLSGADAMLVIRRVGEALLALDRRGRAHGRVRPGNVLFDADGLPYLSDPALSGWARTAGDASDYLRLVRTCLHATLGGRPAPPWLDELDASDERDQALVADIETAVTEVFLRLDTDAPTPENPYVGLRAFDERDAGRFFGRDALVAHLHDQLLERTEDMRVLLVVGGSGSGKSSVVRAGLTPLLRVDDDRRWVIATLTPGPRPFDALRQALTRVAVGCDDLLAGDLTDPDTVTALVRGLTGSYGRLLLVVDQLEELFTLASPGDRERLLDVLAVLATTPRCRAWVLGTVRADFFDRPLDHPTFGALASRAAVAIPAMTPADLEQAVAGPAAKAGLSVQPGLTAELVTSVAHRPAALPALQFTLFELAERSGHQLEWEALDELGGVDGAIGARADALLMRMAEPEQRLVRRMFERLVVVSAAGEPTRRQATRAELVGLAADPVAAEHMLETWIAARLLVGDRRASTREATVDIAHEAVLTRWPRLQSWIDESRETLLALHRLADDAQTWQGLDRDPAALLRGARLENAEAALDSGSQDVSALTSEYVEASVQRRRLDEQARADAAALRARTTRRLRVQRGLLAVALVLAVVVGGVALDLRGQAARNAVAAQARAQAATAGLVAASDAATASDWSLALLLAAEAYRIHDSPQTRQGLAAVVTRPAPIPTLLHQVDHPHDAVAVDPETGLVAVKSPDGQVDVIDPDTGDVVAAGLGGIPRTAGGALDIHNGLLATGGVLPEGGRALVYRLDDGAVVAELTRPVAVADLAFAPDGEHLALVGIGGRVDVYDVNSWSRSSTLEASEVPFLETVSWSADGRRVFGGSGDGRVLAWDVPRAGVAAETTGPVIPAASLTLDEAGPLDTSVKAIVPVPGRQLLVGQAAGESYLLEAATLDVLSGPVPQSAWGADVDPKGSTIALAQQTGLTLAQRSGEAGSNGLEATTTLAREVSDVAFTDDGSLITVGSAGAVLMWQVHPPLPGLSEIEGLAPGLPTFSPDGRLLTMWGQDSGVRLFDAETYAPLTQLALPDNSPIHLLGIAFQPDRDRIVVSYCPDLPPTNTEPCAAVVAAYDVATGERVVGPVEQGPVLTHTSSSVRASDTVDLVATGQVGGAVTLRDADTLQPTARLDDVLGSGATERAWLRMSSTGDLLMASVTPANRMAVWDLTTPTPQALVDRSTAGIGFFTPDGDIVIGNDGGQMAVVNPRTGTVVHQTDTSPVVARATFTADGSIMGASDYDQNAWLWSTSDWQPVAGPINVAGTGWDAVHPDGTHLLINGDVVHRFPLDPQQWYDLACQSAGRNLTEAEWGRYFPDEPYRQTCPDIELADNPQVSETTSLAEGR